MVIYRKQAENDLIEIFYGLCTWEKYSLTFEHAESYIDAIADICDSLDKKSYHANAVYADHKRYGAKVYKYKRTKQTMWYIIYDIDRHGDVFVNKIMSNYQTISE
jgi:plasmid stabilization system protein ParE